MTAGRNQRVNKPAVSAFSLRAAGLIMLLFIPGLAGVQAEINDYQIRRLILYQTGCKLDSVARQPTAGGALNFLVACQNLSFYPDGVLIECGDGDDETTCKVQTESRSFDLKMLQQD